MTICPVPYIPAPAGDRRTIHMLRHLLITAHLLGVRLNARFEEAWKQAKQDERGSVTIEQVAWAVAVIAFVALAAAAIRAYVSAQAGRLG